MADERVTTVLDYLLNGGGEDAQVAAKQAVESLKSEDAPTSTGTSGRADLDGF